MKRRRQRRRRKHISLTTKLAAVLLMMHPQDRETAKAMTAKQYIKSKRLEFDHGVLHALGGSAHFSNLSPLPFAEHRQKSRCDTAVVAKVKRLDGKWQTFMSDVMAGKKPTKKPPHRRWPKRKIPSRPFPHRGG